MHAESGAWGEREAALPCLSAPAAPCKADVGCARRAWLCHLQIFTKDEIDRAFRTVGRMEQVLLNTDHNN